MIRLRVLGPVDLRDDEGNEYRNVLAQPKRLALLATLVVGPPGFRRRDSLLALLWPELDQTHARAALNQALHFLRREFGGSADAAILSRGADELGIDPSVVWCDAMAFREHIEFGRHQDALELYRGNLLEGFFVEQSEGFENWLERERDLLRLTATKAARAAVGIHEKGGDLTPAIAAARRAVDLSRDDERVVRELLELLNRLGDRAGALQAYQEFARRLEADFGVSPAPQTQALIEDIRNRVQAAKKDDDGADRIAPQARADGEPVPMQSNGSARNIAETMFEEPSRDPSDRAKKRWPRVLLQRLPWIVVGAALGAAVTRCGG